MDTLAEIDGTILEAQRYQDQYPRDRGIRGDLALLHQRRAMAARSGGFWVREAEPHNLARLLDGLNDAWQNLMMEPRNHRAQDQVKLQTEFLFRAIITAQRVHDGEWPSQDTR